MKIIKRLTGSIVSKDKDGESEIYEHEDNRMKSAHKIHFPHICIFSTREDTAPDVYNDHIIDHVDVDFLETSLCEDVYSILYVCNNQSTSMLLCIGVIILQYGLLVLIFNETTANSEERNPFNFPSGTNYHVYVGQILGLALIITSQDDFINAVSYFYDDYSPEILLKAPHATKLKYVISGLLKLFSGFIYICINFILVLQSTTVVGMFLNFAALSFIFSIDDIFFSLSEKFFFTDDLAVLACKIKNMKVPVPQRIPSSKNAISSYRFLNFCLVNSVMYIIWVYILMSQYEGRYACESILVQFGDVALPYLPMYSGAYDRVKFIGTPSYQKNRRFNYLKRDGENAVFSFCDKESAWTLSIMENNQSYEEIDPCQNYVAKSKNTKTFDIQQTSDKWLARNNITNEIFEIDTFSLIENECSDCNGNGNCVNFQCICYEGSYGTNCEFTKDSLCTELYRSLSQDDFVTDVKQPFILYNVTPTVRRKDRPIFFRNRKGGRGFELIEFNGFRWAYTYAPDIIDINNTTNAIDMTLADSKKENYITYLSESVTFGMPRDNALPTIHHWYENFALSKYPVINKNRPVSTWLLCPQCDDENICQNRGICNPRTNRCECADGFVGVLCEKKVI